MEPITEGNGGLYQTRSVQTVPRHTVHTDEVGEKNGSRENISALN